MKDVIKKDKKYVMNTYDRVKKVFVRGKGARVFDDIGAAYLDFSAGIGTNTFGFCDKAFTRAVKKQLKKLQHTSNLFYTIPQVKLAKLLCKKTGAKKVFFSNSGAEANECAIKACRKYSFDTYGANRYEIITIKNSFHGRTLATLSATAQDCYHKSFDPFLEGFVFVEANDIDSFKNALSDKTAGILFETIQGEGGINMLSKEYIEEISAIAKEKDILVMIDEVQTGNGRTGALYSYMDFSIEPDIITTAKGLGGGLPIGATLFFNKTESVFSFGDHGSTFGGNPVSCAGAYSIISRLDDDFLFSVEKKGEYIKKALESYGARVFGKGLMIGFTVEGKNATDIKRLCLQYKLLVLTAKDKVRLLPPLSISYKEIDKALKIIKKSIHT